MKKSIYLMIALILILTVSGCTRIRYPGLQANAIAFTMGEYTDINDGDTTYGAIEFEGRTYIPYGTLGEKLSQKDIDSCLGYIVQSDVRDKDVRVFTLSGDPEHNYLMENNVGSGLMNQPMFWRAIDTKGKDITTPDYIESSGYGFWE